MKASRLIAAVCVLGLASCATSGNGKMKILSDHAAKEMLVPGTTTRTEVKQNLGAGKSIRFDSGYEVWEYEFAHGIPRFVDYTPFVGHFSRRIRREGKEVRILFDPDGIVQKYLVLDIPVDPKASTQGSSTFSD